MAEATDCSSKLPKEKKFPEAARRRADVVDNSLYIVYDEFK